MRVKILITGNAGFVGRAFQRKFQEQGHTIVGIDIVNHLPMDARDFFRKDNTYFDKVIHLAAVVGGRKMIEGSPLALAVDLSIDAEMFGWALRTKPGCITYFSSSAAYPISLQTEKNNKILQEDDIDLNQIQTPDLSYGWAKLTGEMLASHAKNQGLNVHIYRPFSGYGSDQALDYPFPSFIERAKSKADPFEIWGNGEQVRDFIHIDDVVEAAEIGCREDIEVANLCTGRATSFNDLAELICQETGYKPTIKHLEAEPVGVMHRVGDSTYMNSFYKPKITLEEGIERAFAK
jgi:nucleoside-diphosphate-sugar epimerase